MVEILFAVCFFAVFAAAPYGVPAVVAVVEKARYEAPICGAGAGS